MYKLPLEKERKIEGRKNREMKIRRMKKRNNEEIKIIKQKERINRRKKNKLYIIFVKAKVKVTLRLAVSQSVCLGVEPNLGLLPRVFLLFFIFKVTVLSFWGALSDERSGLSCVSLRHCSLQYIVFVQVRLFL
jgi:hypothetical protein